MALEDSFYKLAQNLGEPSVILCDRGTMDSVAYIGQEGWQNILQMTGWSNIELRDNRYDAIVHLISAAVDAPEFYNYGNVARFETVEEAAELDKRLRTAYIGHNQIYVVGGKDRNHGFKGKMQDTINVIKTIVGLPTGKISFKKFLVDTRGLKDKSVDNEFHFRLF